MSLGIQWRGVFGRTLFILLAVVLCAGQSCAPDPNADFDGDGVTNVDDGCPYDPDKIEPGICGCGIADTDSDENGTVDCLEDGCNCGGLGDWW